MSGTLDGMGHRALVFAANAGPASPQNFAAFARVAGKCPDFFIVRFCFSFAERTIFSDWSLAFLKSAFSLHHMVLKRNVIRIYRLGSS